MDTISTSVAGAMQVRKRNGSLEPADVNKIVRAVSRCCEGLAGVDPLRVATKTISGLYNGATTQELDQLSIQTAAMLTTEEPAYSQLAARLLSTYIDKEVGGQEIHSFSQSVAAGYRVGLIAEDLAGFVMANSRKLNDAIDESRSALFEYFGLRTLYDRYLLRDPKKRTVIETPQQFFLRVACGVAASAQEAIAFYELFSSLDYMPSSPTLFNSGTAHPQLSSCFLLDSPQDDLEAIYDNYRDIALLSKFSGGIGVGYTRVRSRGSLIRGTNGKSMGIVPFLKTLDASVAAVNQGGKRKGAACVYLEPWHADIEEFLELRDNTGDDARRTHNINLANWIPDLFMQRVEQDRTVVALRSARRARIHRSVRRGVRFGVLRRGGRRPRRARGAGARLYGKMMRTLAQTGQGWMTFKDASNIKSNQTAEGEQRRSSLEPVHRDHRGHARGPHRRVQPRLDQPQAACDRKRLRLREARAHRAPRRASAQRRHRQDVLSDRIGRSIEQRVASGGARHHGPARRLLRPRPALRQRGSAQGLDAHSRRDLLPRAAHELRTRRGTRAAPGLRAEPCRARRAAVRRLGRDADRPGALGIAARTHQGQGPAQLAADRHRADVDDRLDQRLL